MRRRHRYAVLPALLLLAACAAPSNATSPAEAGAGDTPAGPQTVVLYTCASENVEQAVIAAFEAKNPTVTVEPFRAPTGQLNARIAADVRSGGIQADVIWACDPLTMHGYDEQGLLQKWAPPNAADIPAQYRTDAFTGVAVLYMVLAVHSGAPVPVSWSDLVQPAYRGALAIPDPTFAASALGVLGYFSAAPDYGVEFYRTLKDNGAVQVSSPTDVLTGVDQGTYQVGMTLANAAYADQKKGSPIEVVWPKPGAVAVYGPIGLTTKSDSPSGARAFAEFAASAAGQAEMAKQGTYVTLPAAMLPGVTGPIVPADAAVVAPDWSTLFGSTDTILSDYSAVFG